MKAALIVALDDLESSDLELKGTGIDTDPLQVLVVDDSHTSRNHLRRILEGMGIGLIHDAHNGVQGARRVHEHYYDLVITDYNMPEKNGQELVDYIRRVSGQTGLPIQLVTSSHHQSRLAVAQQSGVSAICDKPFQTAILKRLLEQILSQH